MPDYLLHEGATVLCLHSGKASPQLTDQRVKVGGQKVVTISSVYKIEGCKQPPSAGGPDLTTVQWKTAASRVTASGKPVLLRDSIASCDRTPTVPALQIFSTQTRVKGT
jgi:hypothetical protein